MLARLAKLVEIAFGWLRARPEDRDYLFEDYDDEE